MDRIDPSRLEHLFQQALDLAPEDRQPFLDSACAGDTDLRTALSELLEASDLASKKSGWGSGALHNEAAAMASEHANGPIGLNRYEIHDRIGFGGMGIVYRAMRRDDQFSKIVALKVVQTANPLLVERFHQERQILAELEHPNIAHLLDVGTTDQGLPFLAMEFVDGVPLDRYLKSKKVAQREVLELFRKICSAVSCAHRNLIVHRDLKPANILITADGEPKLLDFGIAKLMDTTDLRTRTGAAVMTPEYASPEQVQGNAITTSSDIYSLGVLLYEALTGGRPYRETSSALDLARAITAEPPKSISGLDRDLENIVLMALRKEPERRYASVDQLSEDLRRYLDGFPVIARPATRSYRAQKFVKRNRVMIAAAALVAVAIAAGGISTVRQARIAARRFDDVKKLANSYLFEVYDGLRDLPGALSLRQLVVKRAVEYLDSLSKEQENDIGLGRELASAYIRVANLQGEPGFQNLGDREGALSSSRKALAILQRLAVAAPGNVEVQSDLSQAYAGVGYMLTYKGDVKTADEMLRKSVDIAEKVVAAHPDDYKFQDRLATNYIFLSNVTGNNEYPNLGNWNGATEYCNKALAIRERRAAEVPSDRENRLVLSTIHERLASMSRAQHNDEGAVGQFQAAIKLDEELVKDDPVNHTYRRELAVDCRSLVLVYLSLNRVEEARAAGDRSADIFEQLARENPGSVQAQEEVADSDWSQGFVLEKANKTDAAFERYDASIALYDRIMKEHPGVFPNAMRSAYQLIAGLAAKQGDVAKATKAAQKELEIDDHYLAISPADIGPQLNRGVAFLQIGQAHQVRAEKTHSEADWREALRWDQQSMDVWLDLKKNGKLNPGYAGYLDRTRKAIEDCSGALKR